MTANQTIQAFEALLALGTRCQQKFQATAGRLPGYHSYEPLGAEDQTTSDNECSYEWHIDTDDQAFLARVDIDDGVRVAAIEIRYTPGRDNPETRYTLSLDGPEGLGELKPWQEIADTLGVVTDTYLPEEVAIKIIDLLPAGYIAAKTLIEKNEEHLAEDAQLNY